MNEIHHGILKCTVLVIYAFLDFINAQNIEDVEILLHMLLFYLKKVIREAGKLNYEDKTRQKTQWKQIGKSLTM